MLPEELNSNQLNVILKYLPGYKGWVPHNQLPKDKLKNGQSLIINLDSARGPGTHWVCVYSYSPKFAIYFDSFGVRPSDTIVSFLKKNHKNVIFSTSQIQSFSSKRCGWYVVHFLNRLSNGEPFEEILASFDPVPSGKNERQART